MHGVDLRESSHPSTGLDAGPSDALESRVNRSSFAPPTATSTVEKAGDAIRLREPGPAGDFISTDDGAVALRSDQPNSGEIKTLHAKGPQYCSIDPGALAAALRRNPQLLKALTDMTDRESTKELRIAKGTVFSIEIEEAQFQKLEKCFSAYETRGIWKVQAAVRSGQTGNDGIAEIGAVMREIIDVRIEGIEAIFMDARSEPAQTEPHDDAPNEQFVHLSKADDAKLNTLLIQMHRGEDELLFRRTLIRSSKLQIQQYCTTLRRFKGRFQELAAGGNSMSEDARHKMQAAIEEYRRLTLFRGFPLLKKLKAIVGPLSDIRAWFNSVKRIEDETRAENAAAYFEMFTTPAATAKAATSVKRAKKSKRSRGPASKSHPEPADAAEVMSAAPSASECRAMAAANPGFERLHGIDGLYEGTLRYAAVSQQVPQSHAAWVNLVARFDPQCSVVAYLRDMAAKDAVASALRTDRQVPRILTVPNGRKAEAFLRTLAGRNGEFSTDRLIADFAEALHAGLDLSLDKGSPRLQYFFGANRNEHDMRFETFGRLFAGSLKAKFEEELRALERPGDRTRILDKIPKLYAQLRQRDLDDLTECALERLVFNENLRAVHVVMTPPEGLSPTNADNRKLAQPRVRALADGSGVYLYDAAHDETSNSPAGVIVPSLSDAVTYCYDALHGRGVRQVYAQTHLAMLHSALVHCERSAEHFEFPI